MRSFEGVGRPHSEFSCGSIERPRDGESRTQINLLTLAPPSEFISSAPPSSKISLENVDESNSRPLHQSMAADSNPASSIGLGSSALHIHQHSLMRGHSYGKMERPHSGISEHSQAECSSYQPSADINLATSSTKPIPKRIVRHTFARNFNHLHLELNNEATSGRNRIGITALPDPRQFAPPSIPAQRVHLNPLTPADRSLPRSSASRLFNRLDKAARHNSSGYKSPYSTE